VLWAHSGLGANPIGSRLLGERSTMEHIWSPWRYRYIASPEKQDSCVFCEIQNEKDDVRNLVLHRGELVFVILNLFPYTTGHLMVVPYEHTSSFPGLSPAATSEMLELAKKSDVALDHEYHPDGFNIGMNLAKAAGAGIADHLHLHVVPRWVGDANFVSVVGETRVLPEDLATTYERLKRHFG
jgi:ATP adenylyltransferase